MFQAAMSCFTFFYVGTPDGQTLFCDGCRETKLEKKKNDERGSFLQKC